VVDAALGADEATGHPFEDASCASTSTGRLGLPPGGGAVSPAGLVPVLLDDGFAVWDTLAIAEYLHDAFPTPASGRRPPARARARSLCAEMHAGFGALRSHCPMNIEASLPEVGARIWAEQEGVRANVARIEALWADALADSGGPFLFGPSAPPTPSSRRCACA
jgi:glutathione S-transferase